MSAITEARPLSFERTVDPHEVWCVAPESTYVTDWSFDREDEQFRIATRLPLTHFKYSDMPHPYPDLVLLSQIASQAGVIVVTELLDVPLDSTFLLGRIGMRIDPLEHGRLERGASRMLLTTDREGTYFKERRTGRPPTGFMTADCTLDGRRCGTLEIQGIWVTDELFQMFRRAGPAQAESLVPLELEPDPHTGRSLARNRVISRLRPAGPRAYVGTVLVDQDDPTFFERPLDHVPGFLMLDAAAQATRAAVCREEALDPERVVVHSAELRFSRFAELDAPLECRVDLSDGHGAITAECTQGGRTICEGKLGATVIDG